MKQQEINAFKDSELKVTVFLMSFNHGKFIAESIESILRQTYTEFELLIVDDCSTDNSWQVIQEYCSRDARIKAVRNSKNEGARHYPQITRSIKTEYVAIAHSDDLWATDKLEKQLWLLESNPNVAACFTGVTFINEKGESLLDEESGYGLSPFTVEYGSRYDLLHHFFYRGNCFCHPSLLIRRSAFDSFGLYAYGLEALPDFCKWIRLACRADIHLLKERLTFFRVHSDRSNTSARNLSNLNLLYIEDFFMLNEFLGIADQDFLKAFPEAREFIPSLSKASKLSDAQQNNKFLFARLCVQDERYYYRLFGLNIIYQLLNDDRIRTEIRDLYGYDEAQFFIDKQDADFFSVIHPEQFLGCDLLYKTISQSKEWTRISKRSFVRDDGLVHVRFELDETVANISNLQFKPESRLFWQYKIIEVKTDDGYKEAYSSSQPFSSENGDLFYDDNPSYTIENAKEFSWIEITLSAKQAETKDLMAFLQEGYQVLTEINRRAWKALMVFRGFQSRLHRSHKKEKRR